MLVEERKAHLRRTERERVRLSAPLDARAAQSAAAQDRFLAAFPPEPGARVALYAAAAGEVGTKRIRGGYLAAGVHLYYPRVMDDGGLAFYPDAGEDGWVPGKYGLLEPRVPPGVAGLRTGFDLVVVPGMAFDGMGRRLGKGHGYYDRFLAGLTGPVITVGLAFSTQILPEVPVDAWDVPVDAIVTDECVIRVAGERLEGRIK